MGTKLNPGPFDCYKMALPGEPMFILLARDIDAPRTVRYWSQLRQDRSPSQKSDEAMIKEARDCAHSMAEWRAANEGAWRPKSEPPEPPEPPETIVMKAVRTATFVATLQPLSNYREILFALRRTYIPLEGEEFGFITNTGRFVTTL